MVDDIKTDVNTDENLVNELKLEQHKAIVEKTIEKNPLIETKSGLNEALLELLKRGQTSTLFQGVERCIRVLDKGSPVQRHCMSMVVLDANNGKICTRCFKQPNPGVPRPTVINSSMIKLNDKELKECGLDKDPTYVESKMTQNTNVPRCNDAVEQKTAPKTKRTYTRRAPKVAVPNVVKIEISLKELDASYNIVNVLLQKTLEAIYELPITKFSEAEAIRGTSERIKVLLSEQGEVLQGPHG